MQLLEVTTPALARDFILVNVLINKGNPNYIRPLNKDIDEVFDSQKNKAFRHGETTRWILKNGAGENIGRIAVFTNKRYKNKGDEFPVGGIGFFDCINDQSAADMLFDVAKHWLMQKGMQAMDGPINFGERDKWWGLVTEGFQSPLYCMNYNPPYYQSLFEHYGFRVFYNQICYARDPKKLVSEKVRQRHAKLVAEGHYRADHVRGNNFEKYAADFATVYNKAWAGHGGLKEIRKEQALQTFKKMKPIMDRKTLWFAYYDEQPIGVLLSLPDLNQWFKYLNGKFGFWQKLYFLWIKKTKPCKKFTGLVFGIVPEFQRSGADSFLITETNLVTMTLPYTEYEMQWIGDFNQKMINVAETFGDTYRSRKLTVYRYLFDRTREFKPHPVIL